MEESPSPLGLLKQPKGHKPCANIDNHETGQHVPNNALIPLCLCVHYFSNHGTFLPVINPRAIRSSIRPFGDCLVYTKTPLEWMRTLLSTTQIYREPTPLLIRTRPLLHRGGDHLGTREWHQPIPFPRLDALPRHEPVLTHDAHRRNTWRSGITPDPPT